MRILVIRHAIAEDRRAFAQSGREDGLRPLTRLGRRRMRRAARGLRRVAPAIDLLACSPLTRAAQTAEIVARAYHGVKVTRVAGLSPNKPSAALLQWLKERPARSTVAVVGHEPHLGLFVSWMLTGLQESFVSLKKGAACMLDCGPEVKAGRASLLWSLKPAHLRALGRRGR